MELTRQTQTGLDLTVSGGATVLTYTYGGGDPREVLARVDLTPVQAGSYQFHVFVNTSEVMPLSAVSVSAGVTKASFFSRIVPLESGDVVTIKAAGLSSDTSVAAVASLRDMTPIQLSALEGVGSVAVDHNYGGTDALAVMTVDGVRIADATIRAYRAADYTAGNRSDAFVVAQTTTNVDGRWVTPMLLDPSSYVLLVFRQGVIQARTVNVTVTAG